MRSLTPLFRHALLATLVVPAACGGRVDGVDDSTSPAPGSTGDPTYPGYPQPPLGRGTQDGGLPPLDAGPPVDAEPPNDASFPDVRDADLPDTDVPDVDTPDVIVPFDAASCYTIDGPPDAFGCGQYTLQLNEPNTCDFSGPNATGTPAECEALCGHGISYCTLVIGNVDRVQCMQLCVGRQPAGLAAGHAGGPSLLGRYFAEAARLEAASVDAFRILRKELVAHGAPRRLLRAASRAARDEVRHARTTGALARRWGGRAMRAEVAHGRVRSIEAIAAENAVEGCVKETFGALTATYQAEHATDPAVAAAMAKIARDETRHAELSWEIARWLEPRLSSAARARIRHARREAIARLEAELSAPLPAPLAREAGLPGPAHAMRMIGALRETLWAA
jgi:hypothetical protein